MSEAVVKAPSSALYGLKTIAGWTLCILLAGMFVMAGLGKVIGRPGMVLEFEHIGLGHWFRYFTGLLELGGAVGLLIPRFSRMAAIGLALIMAGAVIAHLAVLGTPAALPAMLLGLLLLAAWIRS